MPSKKAGEALARAEEAGWPDTSAAIDHQLQRIVAHCRLDESSEDPAVAELKAAATAIDDLRLDYDLLHARHEGDARLHAREAKEALDRARSALR